jgi:hypothetical protein
MGRKTNENKINDLIKQDVFSHVTFFVENKIIDNKQVVKCSSTACENIPDKLKKHHASCVAYFKQRNHN